MTKREREGMGKEQKKANIFMHCISLLLSRVHKKEDLKKSPTPGHRPAYYLTSETI